MVHVRIAAIYGGAGEHDGLGVTIAAAHPTAGFHIPVGPHYIQLCGGVVDDLGPFDDQVRVVEHRGGVVGHDLTAMLPGDKILGGVAADSVEVTCTIRVQGLVFAEPVPRIADLEEPAPVGLDVLARGVVPGTGVVDGDGGIPASSGRTTVARRSADSSGAAGPGRAAGTSTTSSATAT